MTFDFLRSISNTKDIYQSYQQSDSEILIIDPKFSKIDSVNIHWINPCQSEFSGFKSYKVIDDSIMNYFAYFLDLEQIDYTGIGLHNLIYKESEDIIERTSSSEVNSKIFIRLTDSFSLDKIQESFSKKLITGDYTFDNEMIRFSLDGAVYGFLNYERYQFNLDYCFESSLYDKINVIQFFKQNDLNNYRAYENLENKFAFEIIDNKILLFNIIEKQTDNYYGLVKGELIYTLFKKKPYL